MNRLVANTFNLLHEIAESSTLKTSRHHIDVFADRLRKAATSDGLVSCMETLCTSMEVQMGTIRPKAVTEFLNACRDPEAASVQKWLREHSRLSAMIANLKDDALRMESLEGIDLGDIHSGHGTAPKRIEYEVPIKVECLSPLVHGDDHKAGNATIFRRMDILTEDGRVDSLPYYGGNALRGYMRDLLADHFLDSIHLPVSRNKPAVVPWFFQVLYSGGALEERNAASSKSLGKLLGKNGAIKTEGLRRLRGMLPGLSLLGCALGNRVLPGRIQVADIRPRCKQWGTGEMDVSELMTWTFLTRHEDREVIEGGHGGMIANAEALKVGTILDGGIDIDSHASELERSALAMALSMVGKYGRLGAQGRMGLGEVRFEFDGSLDAAPYDTWLKEHADEIKLFLEGLGALVPPDFYEDI